MKSSDLTQPQEQRQEKTYVPPALRCLGTVEAWTMAIQAGNCLDQSFPAGTPITSLTFSFCT